MTQVNTTFGRGDPIWANACVGNNGYPEYWEYAKGFSQAANLLIDKALQGQGLDHYVDELVYPVCFNMRHSVELRLKGAISELILIERNRGRKLEFDLTGSHDIGNIWRFFVINSEKIDDRYTAIINRLEKKINDIAEIDATGQTFRYPFNLESQKHLVDIALINFVKLKGSFSKLEIALDDLHRLNKYLRDEYDLGTFTQKLSRKNLFEVASQLPTRSTWTEESFNATKNIIKRKFKLGSKELSDSIKLIEVHFELSPMIGISIPLLGLAEEDIVEFLDHWFKRYGLTSNTDHIDVETYEEGSETRMQSLVPNPQVRKVVWEAMKSKLTPEILAGLSALFYFARELRFSEQYISIYKYYLRETVSAFEQSEGAIKLQFFRIFEMKNADYHMLRSLYFLKKVEVADRLVSKYRLDNNFSWLDKARSRVLFRKPEYCGYAI